MSETYVRMDQRKNLHINKQTYGGGGRERETAARLLTTATSRLKGGPVLTAQSSGCSMGLDMVDLNFL